MNKRLMMACMAIAAFAAFVFAPAASATTLTEGGKALAVGTSVTAKSVGVTKFTASGFNVECETAHLQGTVTQNNSTGAVKGEIPVGSAVFDNAGGADCSSILGATKVSVTSKLCLEAGPTTDTLKVTGCGANVAFGLNVTASATTCDYATASVSGTFTTNTTPASATVSEQPASLTAETPKHEVFPVCPSSGKLDMTFNLYTTGGTEGLTLS